jgi:putative ABC transport system permease protein
MALSPEYVYEIRGTDLVPDNQRFGVMWMGREALGIAFDMDGAFNAAALLLTKGASEPAVIFQLDRLLEPYGGLGLMGDETRFPIDFCQTKLLACKPPLSLCP